MKLKPERTAQATEHYVNDDEVEVTNSIDIEDDIMEMRAEEQAQMAEAKITLFELVTSPTLKFPLLIAVIMQLSQQLSGINAVIDVNFLLI